MAQKLIIAWTASDSFNIVAVPEQGAESSGFLLSIAFDVSVWGKPRSLAVCPVQAVRVPWLW